jgi:ubiquinone/menaquinone biosynthesis C-methylase UbiE
VDKYDLQISGFGWLNRVLTHAPRHNKFFDVFSRIYDIPLLQRAIYHPVHDAVFDVLRTASPGSVLDVGCGTGILLTRLASLSSVSLVGCDYSIGMLEQAQRRAGQDGAAVRFVQGDGQRLPVRSRAFDAVVTTDAFHFFPSQDDALAEFKRVLVPGGLLVVAVTTMTRAASSLLEAATRLTVGPQHVPTRQELRDRTEAAGFLLVEQRRVARLFPVPAVVTVARAVE